MITIRPLLPWVAPVLLSLVAVTQIYFSHSGSLSPWKGGGFGMFSTVDSPGARFMRIFIHTADDVIPVFVPNHLRKMSKKVLTTGSKDLAQDLLQKLAEGRWVTIKIESATQHYRSKLASSNYEAINAEYLNELDQINQYNPKLIDLISQNFLRMLENDEKPSSPENLIEIKNIHIELWRYSFQTRHHRLVANKFLVIQI